MEKNCPLCLNPNRFFWCGSCATKNIELYAVPLKFTRDSSRKLSVAISTRLESDSIQKINNHKNLSIHVRNLRERVAERSRIVAAKERHLSEIATHIMAAKQELALAKEDLAQKMRLLDDHSTYEQKERLFNLQCRVLVLRNNRLRQQVRQLRRLFD